MPSERAGDGQCGGSWLIDCGVVERADALVMPGLIDCQGCGFAHTWPLPPQDGLDAYYRTYYSEAKPDYFRAAEDDREWLDSVHGRWLAFLERHLPRNRRMFIDVGAGPGILPENAALRGWYARAWDPAPEAMAHLRATLRAADLCERDPLADGTPGAWDVVALVEVLEHARDPEGLLRLVHDRMAPGGIVLLQIPNEFNPLQRAAEAVVGRPWWFAPPAHLNYFTPDTIGALLRRTGFRLLDWTVTFPMELFLLGGWNYVDDPALGRRLHEWRRRFELGTPDELLDRLYRALRELHMGRDLVLFARRPADSDTLMELPETAANYAARAWGEERTIPRQVERLGEEMAELALAAGAGDERAVRAQVGDVALLLADVARLAGGDLAGLMDWKLAQKKERRRVEGA